MLPLSLLCALPALAPQDGAAAASPFDRAFELQITADDVELIDGRGPTAIAEIPIEFEGRLHVWARSALDVALQIDDAMNGSVLATDLDPDARAAYASGDVRQGDLVAVLVAGEAGDTGAVTLEVAATFETDATRAAVRAGREALAESGRLAGSGERDAARERLARGIEELLAAEGAAYSDGITGVAGDMARAAHRLGDLTGARAAYEAVLASRRRTHPPDHREQLGVRAEMSFLVYEQGDLAGARAHQEAILKARRRVLPEDHEDVLVTMDLLAITVQEMRQFAEARALYEAVLEVRERKLPDDHPSLLVTRLNLASSLRSMGEFAEARALQAAVLEARERTLPPDHPRLLSARLNLSVSLWEMGELERARELQESVLEARERLLPADHPEVVVVRRNLANTLSDLGDLAAARALRESALAVYERTLPADHPHLAMARAHVANSMYQMGDLIGARALFEAVLEDREQVLPADHPDLLHLRGNLAACVQAMGELEAAAAMHEDLAAAWERTVPEGHPDLLISREVLANTLRMLGEYERSREIYASVLAARELALPPRHPDVLRARGVLATAYRELGDLARARELEEKVLADSVRALPEGHPELLTLRHNLLLTLHALGETAAVDELLADQIAGVSGRVLAALALAPREALWAVAGEQERLACVIHLSSSRGPKIERAAFELSETLRLVAVEAAVSLTRFERDPELAPLFERAAAVRGELNDLVAGSGGEGMDEDELMRLSLERDRLEREASGRLAERGVATRPVEAAALAARLAPGEAAVGYRRLPPSYDDVGGADRVLAHVLTHAGALVRLDLGSAAELEELTGTWRAALGASLHPAAGASVASAGQRGLGLAAVGASDDAEVGRRLRARVLDPVLAAAGADVERIHVCPDGLLFLLPFDALPRDDGGRVGDVMSVVNEVSFARLLAGPRTSAFEPSLLTLGGVVYGGTEAATDDATRGGLTSFAAIPESGREAEEVAALFDDASPGERQLLTGDEATKTALFEATPGVRYVHVATHGWFAPESVMSSADAGSTSSTRMTLEQRITGLAPMTLCGLALAGANDGRDSFGRVPGILTAEELCSLDLSQCELAVLSACETNVGIRRAGQGIQSLQAALYAAGARTSITSLWKVDDAATRRLFEVFYTSLWVEEMAKAEALWRAKVTLREEGHPPRDWAGWVLTGDPD